MDVFPNFAFRTRLARPPPPGRYRSKGFSKAVQTCKFSAENLYTPYSHLLMAYLCARCVLHGEAAPFAEKIQFKRAAFGMRTN
ncbi:MAG: hypothetical protein C4519_27660 [Desulfobacteraceae bacterium]|nr:MAG: hypothetical protein C4519_27660 [Desulfobacteraceae bacterium]